MFADVCETVPDTSFLFQNASQHILEVAAAMMDGEIAYRKGEFDKAFEYLREAVRRDDALNYDEPWGWMQPTRHALGALLSEQGRFAEAEAVYRDAAAAWQQDQGGRGQFQTAARKFAAAADAWGEPGLRIAFQASAHSAAVTVSLPVVLFSG